LFTETDKAIVNDRLNGASLADVAKKYGITRIKVRQIESRMLKDMEINK
jgi:DNA-directed RNA polymerase sigma subunit (sigma70/sigma32)